MRGLLLLGGLAALVLGMTPWYGVGVLLLVVISALWTGAARSEFFTSLITRFVTAWLLFGAVTMIMGMYAWVARIPMHPLLVFVPYMALVGLFMWRMPLVKRQVLATRSDMLAAALSVVGIVVIALSFYLPRPSLAATVQLVTNGFDNAAHLSLIQTTYEHGGYVYGKYDDIKDTIAWKTLTAYPQGWHAANAFLWQGTGLRVFDGDDRTLALHFYIVTLLAWMAAAIFLCSKVALYATRLLGGSTFLWKSGTLAGFCAAQLLVQMVVIWGSLHFGFASFIGAIAYFMLLSAVLLEARHGRNSLRWIMLVVLCIAAIGLSWLLPVAAALLMACLVFLPHSKRLRTFAGKQKLQTIASATLMLAGLAPVMAMIGISRTFSVQGQSQINDHGGIFAVSVVLVGLAGFAAGWAWLRASSGKLGPGFIAIVVPQLLFTGSIYCYQLMTLGHTEYFFTKSLALTFVLIAPFAIAALVVWLARLRFASWPALYTALVAVAVLAGVVVVSAQDVSQMGALLQRSSKLQTPTARAFAEVVQSGELMRQNVIVFTRLDYGGDVNGNVLSTALNTRISRCVGDSIWLITDHRGKMFPQWIDGCARAGEKVTIITSAETYPLIVGLRNSNIHTVLAQ